MRPSNWIHTLLFMRSSNPARKKKEVPGPVHIQRWQNVRRLLLECQQNTRLSHAIIHTVIETPTERMSHRMECSPTQQRQSSMDTIKSLLSFLLFLFCCCVLAAQARVYIYIFFFCCLWKLGQPRWYLMDCDIPAAMLWRFVTPGWVMPAP